MKELKVSRRSVLKAGALAAGASTLPGCVRLQPAKEQPQKCQPDENSIRMRAILTGMSMPFWYEERGNEGGAKTFWDKDQWAKQFDRLAKSDYNTVIYMCNPWLVHQWQTWLVPHKKFPEARILTPQQQDDVIEQARWIFRNAKEHGLQNLMLSMYIVTTPAFAKHHGLDKDFPPSETVDWRHNYQHIVPGGETYDKMIHWGVRNELTRAFTEEAIYELFTTYPDLVGMRTTMGEALPGKRSSWFKEAIVPGLKRTGRNPLAIVHQWMMPVNDYVEDISSSDVYENVWLDLSHNGEIISDRRPYPIDFRYAEKTGLPVFIEYCAHNMSILPWNSPKWAFDLVKEWLKLGEFVGYLSHIGGQDLFEMALNRYAKNNEPYSDDPWVDVLEERYGDRAAAQHMLNALNISADITPAVNSIAWSPHDGRCTHQLMLRYWHWTDQDHRFSHFTCPSKGATLLPLRHYARVVAQQGAAFRNNDGGNYKKELNQAGPVLHGHPGAQELIWGHVDFQLTPEQHMREVRKMGEDCLKEAEAALRTVKKNKDQVENLYKRMKAYKLLTDYYEHKVLTAVSALIYNLNDDPEERKRAEQLGDETVELYTIAANYIYEEIDNSSGNIKGDWWDHQRNLPGLIETEKEERANLAKLFKWPEVAAESKDGERAQLGPTAQ